LLLHWQIELDQKQLLEKYQARHQKIRQESELLAELTDFDNR
jgi:hypothetical protein